jgi:tetratricopeptide (TPR) repeat protein
VKRKFSWAFLFLVLAVSGRAHYTFTPRLTQVQQAVFELRLYDAQRLMEQESKLNPSNRMNDLVQTYLDCAMLSIDEDRKSYEQALERYKLRDQETQGVDKQSPYYLFNQAECALQMAVLKLKFQDYVNAVFDVRKAYHALEENMHEHPGFILNFKTLGVMKTLIGTVPDSYKWALRIVGLEGDIKEGTAMLQRFIQYPTKEEAIQLFQKNASMQMAYLTLHVYKDKKQAWKQVDALTSDYSTNLFSNWNRASFAMKCGYTDEAISVLSQHPAVAVSYRFDYLNYLLGLAKLHRLDDDADVYLKKYVDEFKGENYLKDACLKLSWYYRIKDNSQQSEYYLSKVKSMGVAHLDEDKHAQKLAEQNEIQQVDLLKARMLFDGGYYTRASQLLRNKQLKDFTHDKLKAEFLYRNGRIYHELNQTAKAIDYYKQCIDFARKMPYYFAANSCLQLGYIYEQLTYYRLAELYYKQCMSYTNHEYRNSLAQKAKTGLRRIEGKTD